jgi:hypothetical protein
MQNKIQYILKMSTKAVKVVIHNQNEPNVHVINEAEPANDWDGDKMLVLDPHMRNLNAELNVLRNKPRLNAVSVVHGLQESLLYWNAWRSSVLEQLCTMADIKLQLHLQQFCDHDDEGSKGRLREYCHQLQTTISVWREHERFLSEEQSAIQASLRQAKRVTKTAADKLQNVLRTADPKVLVGLRVLNNATKALQDTCIEREKMAAAKVDQDATESLKLVQQMLDTILYFVKGFYDDVRGLQKDMSKIRQTAEARTHQKQQQWATMCQQMQQQFQVQIHEPLMAFLKDAKATTTLADQVLDNDNDPYCVKRCEVAMFELQRYLQQAGPATATNNASDSDEMRALQNERQRRKELLTKAQAHIAKIQTSLAQVDTTVQQHLENNMDAKNMATVLQLADERQQALQEELKRTQDTIDAVTRDIQSVGMSAMEEQYRAQHLNRLVESAAKACWQMKHAFDTAVQVESMIQRLVRDQFLDHTRTLHQSTELLLQRTADVAFRHQQTLNRSLQQIQQNLVEVTRRMDTLNRARLEQEAKLEGPEIGAYTILEDYAEAIIQEHRLAFDVAQLTSMQQTVTNTIAFLTRAIRTFHMQ